jgi:hypothetical protein
MAWSTTLGREVPPRAVIEPGDLSGPDLIAVPYRRLV